MFHSNRTQKAIAVAWVSILVVSTASGDEFVPNTFTDGNDGACDVFNCTLREAVILTTGTSGPDVIELSTGVYTLSLPGTADNSALAGDLDINFGQVTIQGTGMGQTVIDANFIDRVFHIGPLGPATLILKDLTIRNGLAATNEVGGGIMMWPGATLIMERVEIFNCKASDDGGGIGAFYGTTHISDSRIINCAVTAPWGNGGGMYVHHSLANPVVIERTHFANNTAPNGGAAIFYASPVQLIDCMFVTNNGGMGNSVASYDVFGPSLIARGTTFTGTSLTTMTINGANTNVQLENCTISGNTGNGSPAILLGLGGGTLSLRNCTVTGNTSGGIQRFAGTFNLKNSIVAGNTGWDINGVVNSQGYNLVGNTNFASIGGDTTGNILNTPAMLGPLADNGGPTLTHLPLEGSPVIDTANPVDFVSIDQRGFPRPLDGNGNGSALPDIGAVEVLPASPPDPGDITGDGVVNLNDLLVVINSWGPCPDKGACPADISPAPNGDGVVNLNDLLMVINNWG